MLAYIHQQYMTWLAILAVFAGVAIAETVATRGAPKIPLRDRLFNVGAGAFLLVGGGYAAYLIITGCAQLRIFRSSELDTIPYVVVFVVLQDFIYYFYHRLQHSWSILWGIHKLHHTDTDVNVTTSHRSHVLEQPIQMTLIVVPSLLFLGYHPTATLYGLYLGLFFLYLSHTRLNVSLGPLGRVFVGPCFHRVHHSVDAAHSNKNFAQFFSFLDALFGTYAAPQSIGDIRTGVQDCRTQRDLWAPMLWPLAVFSSGKVGGADAPP